MSGPVRAVVFDFNGTLSDDEPILCSIYQELFAAHGRPMSEADYYGMLAGNSEEAIIGGWLGVEGAQLSELVAERIGRYRALAADGSTVPETVREAVRYAAVRVPVGIVSGAFLAEIAPVLAGAGIADLFAVLVAADDVTDGKPHPEAYERAVAELGVEPSEAACFEDTEAGVAAAKAAGLRCIAVMGTLPHARLAQADETVETIDVALLRRLLG